MKKFPVAMVVMAVAMLAAACGDETTTIKGPIPVEVQGPVYVKMCMSDCMTHEDCSERELCRQDDPASTECGYVVMKCEVGCEAKFDPIENEDGTSANPKVPGTDTCQRFGDMNLYCDTKVSNKCKEYTAEEPTDVVEPEPDVTPEPDVGPSSDKVAECCYVGNLVGLYGGFGWSESTPADPEAWNGARNREIDENGCFRTTVNMDVVFGELLYAGLPNGLYTDDAEHNKQIKWVESFFGLPKCSIDGEAAVVLPHVQGKGHPFYVE